MEGQKITPNKGRQGRQGRRGQAGLVTEKSLADPAASGEN
jgi:hypothetical protein